MMPDNIAIKAAVVGAGVSAIAAGLVVAQAYNSSDSSFRGRQDRKKKRENLNKLMTSIEEVAAALIELTRDKQLVVSDLCEEIMKTKGFEETFLASAFDFLAENEMLAKGFLVKSPELRKLWLENFGQRKGWFRK